MNTMKWLIKREFWEHKGGFFWAPVVVGAIMTTFLGLTLLFAATVGKHNLIQVNGVRVASLSAAMSVEDKAQFIDILTHGYMSTGMPLLMVLGFVVFFFCLGSLFDERKDRSVLFWKSLPVSDGETVLSKVAMALVVAPLITLVFVTVVSILSLVFVTSTAAIMGFNAIGAVLSSPAVYLAPFKLLAILPVYMLWALPTIGWLMMVSAWARTKPFLWAVGIPLLTGALLSWSNAIFDFNWDIGWFWQNIVARMLLSVAPGSWLGFTDAGRGIADHGATHMDSLLSHSWQAMATANLWIGVLAGVAMLYAAIRLRRWKDEG